MLVDNFSAGILARDHGDRRHVPAGAVRCCGSSTGLGDAVEFLVDNNLLPLTSLFIEPAKVLFLNNAINHGVLTPLGIQEAAETGKSVLFLLEANPGPGLGLLLAYSVFGKGMARATAPGAAIIQFFGGIHEVYFPYVLMRPRLILATIAGGMTGIFINVLFDVGPARPGRTRVDLRRLRADRGGQLPRRHAVGDRRGGRRLRWWPASCSRLDKGDWDEATSQVATQSMVAMKGKKSIASAMVTGSGAAHAGPIRNIVFACDAGMGSSAMGASVLRKKIKDAGLR